MNKKINPPIVFIVTRARTEREAPLRRSPASDSRAINTPVLLNNNRKQIRKMTRFTVAGYGTYFAIIRIQISYAVYIHGSVEKETGDYRKTTIIAVFYILYYVIIGFLTFDRDGASERGVVKKKKKGR